MEGKSMKNKSLVLLLIAGAILSLTGCEKDPAGNGKSGSVKLAFATGAPQTKTAYSGEGAKADGSATTNYNEVAWERIDWIEGQDQLLVWSDNAVNKKTGGNYAKYTVGGPTEKEYTHGENTESWSPAVAYDTEDELFYDGTSTSYNFWGMYPFTAPNGLTASTAATYKPTFTIPSSQSKKSASGNVEKPDMDLAVMFAKAGSYTSTQDVELRFYPAYTAYEFSLRLANDYSSETLELNKIELVSPYEGDITGHRLSGGTVTATIAAEGATTYAFSGSPSNTVAYTFNGATLSKTQDLVFTIFALPEDVTGMKVNFYVGGNTPSTPDRTAVLQKDKKDITFEKCYKHRIKGIAYSAGFSFELEGQVLDWIYTEKNTTFTNQVAANAFSIVGAEESGNHYVSSDPVDKSYTPLSYEAFIALSEDAQNAYLGEHNTYQYRYYQVRTLLMPDPGYFEVTFRPKTPLGGYWILEPEGDLNMFDITVKDVDSTNWNDVDKANFQGQIMNHDVVFRITPSASVPSTRTQPYSLMFKAYFSTNIDFEPALSADSEIQDVHGDGTFSYWLFTIPANH